MSSEAAARASPDQGIDLINIDDAAAGGAAADILDRCKYLPGSFARVTRRIQVVELGFLHDQEGSQARAATGRLQVLAMPTPVQTAPHEWFGQMLDEIDYGMLLLNDHFEVLHANHVAQDEMDARHPLQLHGKELRARRPLDVAPLHDALIGAARRGLRRLFSVGEGAQTVSVAVVPLKGVGAERGAAMLVVLGKRQMCGELSVEWFARNHSLTHAETRVLAALCAGRDPSQIAASQGVSLYTVRTQIGSVRAKTGAISIRELIRQVSMLPPLVSAIRGVRGPAVSMGELASPRYVGPDADGSNAEASCNELLAG